MREKEREKKEGGERESEGEPERRMLGRCENGVRGEMRERDREKKGELRQSYLQNFVKT